MSLQGKYVIGEPIQYTSIYGYPKRRFPIIPLGGSNPVGTVKEEKIIGASDQLISVMYYERNGWKKCGQQRFYLSIEALVEAMGGQIATAREAGKAAPKKAAPKKAAPKKATIVKPPKRRVSKKLAPKRKKAA